MSIPSEDRRKQIRDYRKSVDERLSSIQEGLSILSAEMNQFQQSVRKSLDNAATQNYMSKSSISEIESKVAGEYGKSLRKRFSDLDSEVSSLMQDYKENIEIFLMPEQD